MGIDYEKLLNDHSMIERVGSFSPPLRKGFGENRIENRIQKRISRELYSKRVSIAKEMLLSDSTDTREVVYSALVKNGISPHSVDYYEDYIQLLVDRQGGWDRWRSVVSKEISVFNYSRASLRNPMVILILWLMFSTALGTTLPDNMLMSAITLTMTLFGLTVFSVYTGFYVLPTYRRNIQESIGENKKSTDMFFPYNKVKSYI